MANGINDEALRVADGGVTAAALPFTKLIPALREAFAAGAEVPARHHHHIPQPDGTDAVLLLMPAWQPDQSFMGVKIVSVYPGNIARGLPGLYSTYLLSDGQTGRPLALIDGNQITVRRTVAVSALAASYLARDDAATLLLVGAGRVASLAAWAFHVVRPIREVAVWDIDPIKAASLVAALQADGFSASVTTSLEQATRRADIISCATLSTEPLIKGEWLAPGSHLDLIGSFTPAMREADDTCLMRGHVFIDTRNGLTESGDLIGPIANKSFDPASLGGTLAELSEGSVQGRRMHDEITVFKAVGTALADIAAAALVYSEISRED